MNIVEACKDRAIFRPFLTSGGKAPLRTWFPWFACLQALYGLPFGQRSETVFRKVTQRDPKYLPKDGFDVALFLTGRRSGKSRIAALIGAYEATIAGHDKKLSDGEKGVVAVIAPSKRQGKIVRDYLRAIFKIKLLKPMLIAETQEGFDLSNNIEIRILAGDFRTVRGFTLVAAIIDEAAFFGLEEESKVKSDTELIRAVQPSLATTRGKMIVISSPYAKRGWVYKAFAQHYGNDLGTTLVVNCPSKDLNPTLSQKIIDKALEDDYAAARSEYLGAFRDDIGAFIGRDAVEALVSKNVRALEPRAGRKYFAFVDMSGGRNDAHALAIAHKEDRKVVIDFADQYKINPYEAVGRMVDILQRYRLEHVHGDNYAADWNATAFKSRGIKYHKADRNKSALYLELLPRLASREIQLVDNSLLIDQLASLERRTRSGGKDTIDHPPGGHDDLANAVAGASCIASKTKPVAGALFPKDRFSPFDFEECY